MKNPTQLKELHELALSILESHTHHIKEAAQYTEMARQEEGLMSGSRHHRIYYENQADKYRKLSEEEATNYANTLNQINEAI